ncbi:MAG: PAS domain-containing protein [Planctomycetes bacterium]|nr:PAS domain-containing protein [Planctomycetota bacterium]
MHPLIPQIPIALAALRLPLRGDSIVVDANDAFLRLWGHAARDAVVGKPADPSWLIACSGDAAQAELAAQRPWSEIVRRTLPDGAVREIEVTSALQRDAAGVPTYVLVTCLDVTTRVGMERALRESEQRFRNLAANVPGAIFRYVLQPDGRDEVTYMSPGCIDIWEIRPEQVERDAGPLWAQVEPTDLDALRTSVLDSANTLRPWLFEWRITTPSGRRKWLQGSGRPERLPSGVVAWDSLILDITALKSAEAERRRSDARLRSVFAESPTGLAIFDREGRYTHVNPVLARMNGVAVERHLGRRPRDFLAPELAAGIEASVRHVLVTGEPSANQEFHGETPAEPGVQRHWLTSQFPVVDDRGTVDGVGVVVVETTALKQAEAARAELETRLLHAQRLESIGRLAGGIAHDFNNLLTVILANAEEAEAEAAPGSAQRERLHEITAAARSSAELTRQLLAFARRQVVSPRILAVDAEVQRVLDLLRRLIGEHVELSWRPGAPAACLEIDAGQLSQVVTNLVVNARDASPQGGCIVVATATVEADRLPAAHGRRGPHVCISVGDRGAGMDAETQAQMFEPFFTTKTGGRGTGLGLATVHGIVLQNHGCIDVHSAPGSGTTIDVYLPLHAGPCQPLPVAAAPESTAAGGTVLLVEDEPPLLSLAKRILEQHGYSVLATASAQIALALAARDDTRIDLLVTDLVMPELSGKELAARILALRPDLKVLYLSGYFHEFAAHPGARAAHETFLAKPFTADELAAKVREALGR